MQKEVILIKSSTYKLSKIKDDEFILYHHLGLGDHIICNGLVNYLSKEFNLIHLPVKTKNLKNVKYLYEENSSVNLFEITNEETDVKKYSDIHNLKILKIGFKKRGKPFNSGFYDQLNLPYSYSLKFFSFPKNTELEIKLTNYMKGEFNIGADYDLIHNESSIGNVQLKRISELNAIYVKKDLDIYKNIFLYRNLIQNANEIHCIDSSFLHLVERVDTSAKLFYHNVKNLDTKGANMKLIKNWEIIDY